VGTNRNPLVRQVALDKVSSKWCSSSRSGLHVPGCWLVNKPAQRVLPVFWTNKTFPRGDVCHSNKFEQVEFVLGGGRLYNKALKVKVW
jgi:hypothetical protein